MVVRCATLTLNDPAIFYTRPLPFIGQYIWHLTQATCCKGPDNGVQIWRHTWITRKLAQYTTGINKPQLISTQLWLHIGCMAHTRQLPKQHLIYIVIYFSFWTWLIKAKLRICYLGSFSENILRISGIVLQKNWHSREQIASEWIGLETFFHVNHIFLMVIMNTDV